MTTTSTQSCCDIYAKWKTWGLNSNERNINLHKEYFLLSMSKDFLWYYRTYLFTYEESVLVWRLSEDEDIRSEFLLGEDNFAIQVVNSIFTELIKDSKIQKLFLSYFRANWDDRYCCKNGEPKGKLTILRDLINSMYNLIVSECSGLPRYKKRINQFHCTTVKEYLGNLLLRVSMDLTDSVEVPFRSAVLSGKQDSNTISSEPNIILSEDICFNLMNELKAEFKSISINFPIECDLCCALTPNCYSSLQKIKNETVGLNKKTSEKIQKFLSLCGPYRPMNSNINSNEISWEKWQ